MQRSLEPELLDALPPTHPDALHNRRDLRLTNVVMRNHAWLRRVLPPLLQAGERALEIGAGDGALALALAQQGLAVDAIDLWPAPSGWPSGHRWYRTDLRDFTDWDRYAVVYGNLIFHQFADEDLRSVGQKLGSARTVLACEPTRRRRSQWIYRAVAPLLGANYVTLHDAHVSIAAGFVGEELPTLLGLDPRHWQIRCETAWIGAYRMMAQRRT